MIQPAKVDLRAYRGVPFSDVTAYYAVDYSTASFVMEIRATRDQNGPPLVSLSRASSPVQGVSATVVTPSGIPISSVAIRIDETTIEALAFTRPRGGDLLLFYALDISGGGHDKARRMQGCFIVEASANG